jgi:hypothetical protein
VLVIDEGGLIAQGYGSSDAPRHVDAAIELTVSGLKRIATAGPLAIPVLNLTRSPVLVIGFGEAWFLPPRRHTASDRPVVLGVVPFPASRCLGDPATYRETLGFTRHALADPDLRTYLDHRTSLGMAEITVHGLTHADHPTAHGPATAAIAEGVRQGLLAADDPLGETGVRSRTYRLPDQPRVRIRRPGPQSFDLIPPLELAALLERAAVDHGWEDEDALYRAALDLLGLKRRTANVLARLRQIRSLVGPALYR